ncbi:ADP-ribosylation factor 1-like [Saccostrea cucullata]|uniref:ADP-ribosylation factor 1-like n=1 Tax=Saccostrea cuccullata TaxID=36930 RepID=UPI002ED6329D
MRPLLRHYYPKTNAFVLVVDCINRNKITDAKEELHRLAPSEVEVNGVPIAVALNMRDFPDSMSKDEIMEELEIETIQKDRPCEAFLTTIRPTDEVETEFDKLMEWIVKETAKQQNEPALRNPKEDRFSAYIWQPIMKMKSFMFD